MVMSIGFTLNSSGNPGGLFYTLRVHVHALKYKRGIKKRPEINLA
jgi:hypothetical protein